MKWKPYPAYKESLALTLHPFVPSITCDSFASEGWEGAGLLIEGDRVVTKSVQGRGDRTQAAGDHLHRRLAGPARGVGSRPHPGRDQLPVRASSSPPQANAALRYGK